MEANRRNSYEAFLKLFYPPPPPPPPPPQQQEVEKEPLTGIVPHGLDLGGIADVDDDLGEEEEEENSSSDASECAVQKLTRAQRKKLRKKKLKESASRRRKIIGPMLPSTEESHGVDVSEDEFPPPRLTEEKRISETIIRDASDEFDAGILNNAGEPRNTKNKLKQRRLAKRFNQSTANCSNEENRHQAHPLPCSDDRNLP